MDGLCMTKMATLTILFNGNRKAKIYMVVILPHCTLLVDGCPYDFCVTVRIYLYIVAHVNVI